MVSPSGTPRLRVLVLLDADIVVRAFIASKTFAEIEARHDVEYVYAADTPANRSSINIDLASYGIKDARICEISRLRRGYWYYLFAAHALNMNRGTDNYELIRTNKFVLEMGERNTRIVEILGHPLIYPLFRRLFFAVMGRSKSLEALLDERRPDIVIYPTLLTGWFLNDIVPAANRRGIPTVLCMNSWDNPTSKAVSTGMPTRLVVWGEQSKQESVRYLGIPEERIECFGAAQFQVYRTPPSASRAELCQAFGVPENRKIILYAGTGESLNETRYLQKLDEAAEQGVLPGCHILYRPHPWRGKLQIGEQDFFALPWRHVSMDPNMADYYKREIVNPSRKFFMTDYEVTNRLLTLVDGVVSARSTLLLEALVKGRPILILFPREIDGLLFRSDMVHFRSLVEASEVNSCFDVEKIDQGLRSLFAQMSDPGIADRLRPVAEHFAVMSGDRYGARLERLLNELVHGTASEPAVRDQIKVA